MAQSNTYANVTGSGLIASGRVILSSLYVNNTTSGVIRIIDGITSTQTIIGGSITPAIGFHDMDNTILANGLYITVMSGSIDLTVKLKNAD